MSGYYGSSISHVDRTAEFWLNNDVVTRIPDGEAFADGIEQSIRTVGCPRKPHCEMKVDLADKEGITVLGLGCTACKEGTFLAMVDGTRTFVEEVGGEGPLSGDKSAATAGDFAANKFSCRSNPYERITPNISYL